MKQAVNLKMLLLAVAISGVVLSAAVAQNNSGKPSFATTDTTPKKKKQIRDLDEAMLEFEAGEEDLQKALKEIDLQKIEADVRASLKEINVAQLKADVQKAMNEVDEQKLQADVQKAMATIQIDMKSAMADAQKEMAQVNMEEIKKEVNQSFEKLDLQKMKGMNWEKMEKDLAAIQPELEKQLATVKVDLGKAKENIQKAKAQIASYKELVDALDADGLLKKDNDYEVVYKDGGLTVDSKILSSDAVKKYSKMLEGKKNFTIQKKEGNFNINSKE